MPRKWWKETSGEAKVWIALLLPATLGTLGAATAHTTLSTRFAIATLIWLGYLLIGAMINYGEDWL